MVAGGELAEVPARCGGTMWRQAQKVLQLCATRNTESDMGAQKEIDEPHDDSQATVVMSFNAGTVCVQGLEESHEPLPSFLQHDDRIGGHRAPAVHYAELIVWLRANAVGYRDEARGYTTREESQHCTTKPFYYQTEALDAWRKNAGRGVVVLPTGSGKTFVAMLAMSRFPRSTLVVAPTLDLVHQWYDQLRARHDTPVGIIGGGYHDPRDITVTTYDSAHIHMERLGHRYGFVIFDECHHLPSESYAWAAQSCLAPFRLGLTATPERTDGGEARYAELIGPVVYRRDIDELSGDYLADYETHRIEVVLTSEERAAYDSERNLYLAFLRKQGIRMSSPRGWSDFIMRSSRSDEGRRAFLAYRNQKQLALTASGKMDAVQRLLFAHRRDRTIIFTEDNATVYALSRRFLLPAITHQSKVKERSSILKAFNDGSLRAVVTSKVLNEGVNVPEANVAIVLSGSASVREHVQRLGRILRKREGKHAVLYELVSAKTSEEGVSQRRREHRAYH
jgi:superfamily II DNA or RNA helicase